MIGVGVPDLQRLPPGETRSLFDFSADHVGIDEWDVANQGLISHHFRAVGDRWELTSTPFRYVWPEELDLMAELAGLSLRHRWSDWHRSPFTSESRSHIYVWQPTVAFGA